MSNEKQHEEKIIERLKNMPKIKDETPKHILYQRVSSNLNNGRTRKKRTIKLLPVIGSVFALALIIFIPFMLNSTSHEVAEENAMEQFIAQDRAITPESDTQSEIGLQKEEDSRMQDEAARSEEAEQEIMMAQEKFNHFVVNEKANESNLIYGAIPDEQFQYAIPITFVVSNSENINEHYNRLQQYISEAGLLYEDYLFEDVTFTIDMEAKVVRITLPETYVIDSSAQANMFVEMLEAMFVPLGIEKAIFVTDGDEAASLGPIGTVEELTLQSAGKTNYKLYREQFLVPIPLEQQVTIDEAILDMKINQEAFYISQTIPDNIHFSIESNGSELNLTYSGEEELSDNQQMVTMIEAILMTAKSYSYESVKFTNMNIPSIGNYALNEAISVPDAVNPIIRE